MAEKRNVVVDERAAQRAEKYIALIKERKGIRLTIGSVFAMALDKMLETEPVKG